MLTPDLASARWVKSNYSENGMNCVEVAQGPDWTALRDSKRPESAPLLFPRSALDVFLAGVKAGEFDR